MGCKDKTFLKLINTLECNGHTDGQTDKTIQKVIYVSACICRWNKKTMKQFSIPNKQYCLILSLSVVLFLAIETGHDFKQIYVLSFQKFSDRMCECVYACAWLCASMFECKCVCAWVCACTSGHFILVYCKGLNSLFFNQAN